MIEKPTLEQLYDTIGVLRNVGETIPEKLLGELSFAEEQYLKEALEPILSKLQRPLNILVSYTPEEPLQMELSADILPEQEEVSDPIADFVPHRNSNPRGPRAKNMTLRVTDNDTGQVFGEKGRKAIDTFCELLVYIGLDRVRELRLTNNSLFLVSNVKDPNRRQRQFGQYYISANNSTKTKADLLGEIAQRLGLNLKIEII